MLAIMGSSGAGKTTLLTLLSGKKANELKITGSVNHLFSLGRGEQYPIYRIIILQFWCLYLPKRYSSLITNCPMYFYL